MKTGLLKNWNLMRLLRLVIGAWAVIAAFQTKETVFGLVGGLLLVTALMNIDCCRVNGCGTPMSSRKNSPKKPEEVSYEEIT